MCSLSDDVEKNLRPQFTLLDVLFQQYVWLSSKDKSESDGGREYWEVARFIPVFSFSFHTISAANFVIDSATAALLNFAWTTVFNEFGTAINLIEALLYDSWISKRSPMKDISNQVKAFFLAF